MSRVKVDFSYSIEDKNKNIFTTLSLPFKSNARDFGIRSFLFECSRESDINGFHAKSGTILYINVLFCDNKVTIRVACGSPNW